MAINKKAANEDEIGVLHKLITMCHNMKGQAMMDAAKTLIDNGCEPEELAILLNSKDLAVMQKWVEYNGVSCTTAEDEEGSDLSKRLKKLKEAQSGKVVSFIDAKEAM